MTEPSQYEYVVDLLRRFAPGHSPVVLDYGCGGGQVVQRALASGMDAHGVDVFYDGGALRDVAAKTGLFGARIHELDGDRIPRASESVDVAGSAPQSRHVRMRCPASPPVDRRRRAAGRPG